MRDSRVRLIAEIALTLALALLLRRVTPFQMPFGGAISLDMLPLFVFALRRGPVYGVLAGALYGVLDVMFEPAGSIVYWAQLILDFPLAYALVGLAGLFRPLVARGGRTGTAGVVVGCVTGGAARFVAHFLSGVVFFATTVMGGPLPAGISALSSGTALRAASVYSFLYNGAYMLPSTVAATLLALVLVPALRRAVPVPEVAPR